MARSKKQKGRNRQKNTKGKKRDNVFTPKFIDNRNVRIGGRFHGILETNMKGYGLIRKIDVEFSYHPRDPFMKPEEIRHHELRPGLVLEGEFEQDQQGNRRVSSIDRINGEPAEHWQKVNRFELQTPIMPNEQIKLGQSPEDIELRSEEHTSELQSRGHLVCRLLLEKKNEE